MKAIPPHIKYILMTPLKMECEYLIQGFKELGLKFLVLDQKNAVQIKNPNVLNQFENVNSQKNKKNHDIYISDDHNFLITWGGHGKVNYAVHASDIISKSNFNIEGFICLGSAGALEPDLNIGDIVIGEKTIEHDFKSSFLNFKKPEFTASPNLLDLFKKTYSFDFKVSKGLITSGDEDIVSSKRATLLREETNAMAAAWEGAGGAKACQHLNIPFVEVRVITDLCNEDTIKDFKSNLKHAMSNLSHVIFKSLS
jgi:adenosylhomocysteine nucleosidase